MSNMITPEIARKQTLEFNNSKETEEELELRKKQEEFLKIALYSIDDNSKKGKTTCNLIEDYYNRLTDYNNKNNLSSLEEAERIIYYSKRELQKLGFDVSVLHNPMICCFGIDIEW